MPAAAPAAAYVPAPAKVATVIQAPAGSNVKVVTVPAASPVTMYVPPADTASVMVQGERPAPDRMPPSPLKRWRRPSVAWAGRAPA